MKLKKMLCLFVLSATVAYAHVTCTPTLRKLAPPDFYSNQYKKLSQGKRAFHVAKTKIHPVVEMLKLKFDPFFFTSTVLGTFIVWLNVILS